jgi:signal peptidase II
MAGLVPAISSGAHGARLSGITGTSPVMTGKQNAMTKNYLHGPLTRFGLIIAAVTALLDQASKLYLLFVLDLGTRGVVHVLPFIDFVLTKNTGISYGLFQSQGALGQWLLLAVKAVAVVLLWIWLARAHSRLAALSLGLIIGGAIGNAVDRLVYGWVADFVLFHISAANWQHSPPSFAAEAKCCRAARPAASVRDN